MNILEILISKGFKAITPQRFNPSDNWNGVSVYSPDARLIDSTLRKEMILSLNGMLYGNSPNLNSSHYGLMDSMAIKYISLSIDDKIVYESFTGVMPDDELLRGFIDG
jgi:hypothetical protein